MLAVAFLLFGVAELLSNEQYHGQPAWIGPRPLALAAIALITLPLALRRSRPMLSNLVVFATIVVYSLAIGDMEATTAFLTIVVAVFSGAAYARHPSVVAGLALVVMSVHNAFDSSVTGPGDWFWSFGFIAVAFLLGGAVRNKQIRIVSLEHDADARDRLYAEQVAAATAAERAAIARELHDIVAHAVSVIVVQAQAGSRSLPDDPTTTARLLEVIEDTGRSALSDLRRLLRVLHQDSGTLDPSPGLGHLSELVDRFRDAGQAVRLELPPELGLLSTASDLAAYRLVQEGLTNTMRHAPGARATVRVRACADHVELEVRDDGATAQVVRESTGALGSGRGLIGMRERVGLAGGRLLACGPDEQGFRVLAWLPLGDGDLPMQWDWAAGPLVTASPGP